MGSVPYSPFPIHHSLFLMKTQATRSVYIIVLAILIAGCNPTRQDFGTVAGAAAGSYAGNAIGNGGGQMPAK